MAGQKPRDGPSRFYLLHCSCGYSGTVKMRAKRDKLTFGSPAEAFSFLQGQIALQEVKRRTNCDPRLYYQTRLFLLPVNGIQPCRAMQLWKKDNGEFHRHVVQEYMVYYLNQKLCIRRRAVHDFESKCD